MPGYQAKEEEQVGSRQRWIADTHEAVRDLREIRREIPAEYVRTRPYQVPQMVDYYNRMLIEFWAQIAPVSNAIMGDRWTEELVSVPVPVEGDTVEVGPVRSADSLSTSELLPKLETTSRPVSLAKIRGDWSRDAFVTFSVSGRDEWTGEFEEQRTATLHLPVYAGDAVFDQLNKCLEDLGWLPEAAEVEVESEPLL